MFVGGDGFLSLFLSLCGLTYSNAFDVHHVALPPTKPLLSMRYPIMRPRPCSRLSKARVGSLYVWRRREDAGQLGLTFSEWHTAGPPGRFNGCIREVGDRALFQLAIEIYQSHHPEQGGRSLDGQFRCDVVGLHCRKRGLARSVSKPWLYHYADVYFNIGLKGGSLEFNQDARSG